MNPSFVRPVSPMSGFSMQPSLGVAGSLTPDFVIGFQYGEDASRFLEELRDRFKKFSLELHPEKTRLIRFGRFAMRDAVRFDGRRKPETFDFLGFTHFCRVN